APLGKENARLTFAVTAVKSGNESARALAYTSDAIITEYGTIPGEKAGYPYSVFAKGASEASYTYIGSYDMFNTAINAAKELLYTGKGAKRGGTAVVYMTRDSKASGDSFNNGSQIEGTVIVDLGTHALTSGVNRLIGFEAKSVGSGGVSNISRVEVRNGSLYTLTKPIAEVFSASGFTYSGTKKFELLFENVTFGRAAVATSGVSILKSRGEFTSTKKAELKAEFKDCTFSYDPQGSAITLIDCSAGGEFVKCSVTMTAGKVKAPGSTTVTLFKGSINDTITYSQNEKGESTLFEYSGEVAPIITKYGTIPTADMTSDKYFAVFARKKDSATYDYKGTFGTLLKGALNNARDMVKRGSGEYAGGEVVVYMYKDHTYQAIGSDNGSFNRAFMIDGTLTFDLGGNTITGKRARLIGFETGSSDIIGAAEDHTTTVVFKNGSILSGNPVLEVFGGSSTFSGTKTVSVAFENVTFRTTASSVTVVGARGSFASGQKINLGLSFSDCTFDYASGASFTVFSDSTSNGAVTSDVTVLGSAFKASGMDAVTFFLSSDASDSFTFEKANGEYASLELPSGSAYPEGTYNGGSLEFRRTESGSVYDIYTLDAAGLGSYLPKMSFTVSDKIIMNVYIPKDKTVSFTLDGKEYTDLSSLTVWALGDGKEYYLIEIVLPSYEAARAVALEASVLAGHETALGSFTFSLPKYAEGLMEAEDIERDLFLDLLSYVRAAYVYFGKSDAEAMAKIEELLYENYDNYNLPSFESAPADDPEGLIGATFVLGDNPSIRFYIPSVAEAESYSFYIGDKKLSVSVGKDTVGKYINIPLGIAELSLPIICKRGESELGSYHIKSYCEWAKSINNSALERLVLRLSRYAESAKRYQTRVTVEIEYVDASGEKLAPSSVKTLALGEEYSVRSAAVSGYYARDLFVSGVADESKKISVVYKPIPSGADAELINEFLPNIVAWGDSITAGVGQNELTYANQYGIDLASLGSTATGANYTAVLKNLIASYMYSGIDVANCGVGGEATSTIAARADTESYYLYLDGEATIGSSAAVIPLAHYASGGRVGILRQGGSPTVNPVTIVGKDKLGNDISVTGTISMAALKADAPAGLNKNTCDAKYLEYTFTRNDGKTDTLEFASGARVISKASYLYDGRTAIIFMGENGGYSDAAELIRQQEEILAAVGSPEHYLIISTTSGTNESRSGIRKALSERWGERYINMGDELNSRRESYEFAGYSKADVDKIMGSIAEGSVTPLFIKDNCHPNAVGYAVIGNIVFERLYKIGAFDEIFDYYDRMNGIKTETFEFNGYTATVIRPENPNGKWIWKTEFLTAFDKAERHLLDEGYTRVYYSISNKYGSPEAVGLMKSFYHEVKGKYSLDDKCILFGFSRGGLYAFNFALAHPECVDKMYLDAPVLDLKTWPTKANNPTEFSGMLLSYGLSEEEFASFNGSPIDKLEEFFALNIPLLIVAGDSDVTVPFEDNAGRLIEYAKANGHTVKYIVKPGADHHPHSLDDVTEILEFCKG
ncbi:MAG: prolyl oligopeptidase family serine peptidase, partial [Clostridia bacterium]|nr:prolyl oligopeptidase family serine peptidase [Clostridia bacterium]